MQTAAYESKQSIMQRIITVFVFTLLVATIGLYTGQFIPPALMLPLSVLEVIMIFAAFWLRRKNRRICVCLYIRFHFRNDAVSDYQPLCVRSGRLCRIGGIRLFICDFAVLGTIGAKTKKDLSFYGPSCLSLLSRFSRWGSLIFSAR